MLTQKDKRELLMIYDGLQELFDALNTLSGDYTSGYREDNAFGKMSKVDSIIYRHCRFEKDEETDYSEEEYEELYKYLENPEMDMDERIAGIFG